MPRIVGFSLAALALVLIAMQVILPRIGAGQVEGRLTEGGGQAEVELKAFPAARLLFSDGDSFQARGRDLDLELRREERVFDRLDGFGEVDMVLDDIVTGPLEVSHFALRRGKDEPDYRVRFVGSTTPRAVAGYLGGPFGGLAAGALPGDADAEVPVDLTSRILSNEGQVEAVAADGEVGGIPAGPLAELVVDAVLGSL